MPLFLSYATLAREARVIGLTYTPDTVNLTRDFSGVPKVVENSESTLIQQRMDKLNKLCVGTFIHKTAP